MHPAYLKPSNRIDTILDYRKRINLAMQYIQEHAGEVLEVKTIADVASFSPFHFHRIFAACVGETLADYIKRIRMKKAASLVIAGCKIEDVAHQTGYGSSSAFGKVFRETYGIVPSVFKKVTEGGTWEHPTMISNSKSKTLINDPPRIIEEPARTLLFIRKPICKIGFMNENIGKAANAAFESWFHILDLYRLRSTVSKKLGVIRGTHSITQPWYYDAGVVLAEDVFVLAAQDEIQRCEIAAGKWAVFLHKGPYNTLWQTWNWIFRYWFWKSGMAYRNSISHEVYLNYKQVSSQKDYLTEIYIPII